MRHGEADGWPDKGIMTRKCRRWVDRCMVKSERKSGTHRVMAGPVLEWAGSLQMLGHCPHQSHRESNRSCRRCAVPLDRGTCSMRKEKKSQWDFFFDAQTDLPASSRIFDCGEPSTWDDHAFPSSPARDAFEAEGEGSKQCERLTDTDIEAFSTATSAATLPRSCFDVSVQRVFFSRV